MSDSHHDLVGLTATPTGNGAKHRNEWFGHLKRWESKSTKAAREDRIRMEQMLKAAADEEKENG